MTSPDTGHVVTPEVTRVSGRRFVAHVVDGVLVWLLFVIAILLVAGLPSGTVGDVVLGVVLVGGLTVGHVAYIIAFIGMMSSARRQRLGDRWAETFVVRDR